MPTIQIEAQMSTEQLVRALEQMPGDELEMLISRVLALRAQRAAPHLPSDEAALLLTINQALLSHMQVRYNELIAGRRAETLTPDEHAELLDLTNQIEQQDVERVAALIELARIRQTTLQGIMNDLCIEPPPYA